MAVECCDNAGGRVELTIGGQKYAARAAVTIRPTNVEVTGGANQDGSQYFTTAPRLFEMDITFSDRCGLRIGDLAGGCLIDVTANLVDMKRRYLFTRARMTGRPSVNSETGEISGMTVMAQIAKQIN